MYVNKDLGKDVKNTGKRLFFFFLLYTSSTSVSVIYFKTYNNRIKKKNHMKQFSFPLLPLTEVSVATDSHTRTGSPACCTRTGSTLPTLWSRRFLVTILKPGSLVVAASLWPHGGARGCQEPRFKLRLITPQPGKLCCL